MKLLAIETSCDDTSAAVVSDGPKVLAAFLSSQIPIHRKYGGVVPEVASRKHLETLIPTTIHTLQKSEQTTSEEFKVLMGDIDALAVTTGPGLVGSLLVGINTAKTLAWLLKKPIIGVNHIRAHIFANFLENPKIAFPAISLVVSGGHTELIYLQTPNSFKIIGKTRDDAAGEAFDKVAKLLGLPYPGGPEIERAARSGKKTVDLPVPMADDQSLDFSFSGLKTAVLYLLRKSPDLDKNDLCASFQDVAIKSLLLKSQMAVSKFRPKSFLLAGGVAANQTLKKEFEKSFKAKFPDIDLYIPPKELCTDNAAMVGVAAYFDLLKNRRKKWYDIDVSPIVKLDE